MYCRLPITRNLKIQLAVHFLIYNFGDTVEIIWKMVIGQTLLIHHLKMLLMAFGFIVYFESEFILLTSSIRNFDQIVLGC